MKNIFAVAAFILLLSVTARADVWKWVDETGKTHFVDTKSAVYTWMDDDGERHYSDTPGHEDAVSVDLVWHSSGTLADLEDSSDETEDGGAYPGETEEDRFERKKAEAYYCKRATEIYESYRSAPQLYRTNEDGEREYLSKKDAAIKLAETRAKRDDLCG